MDIVVQKFNELCDVINELQDVSEERKTELIDQLSQPILALNKETVRDPEI